MALRPDINLSAGQANLTKVLPLFQEAREARHRRDIMPLKEELTQQRVDSGQLKLDQDREDALTRSVVEGAAMVKPFIDNNDREGARNALLQRRSQLQAQGIDTSNTDQALDLLDANPGQFRASMDALVEFGNQAGILGRGNILTGAERSRAKNLKTLEGARDDKGQLKPRDQLTVAQEIAAIDEGLIPRAVGSSAITTATTEGLTEKVAKSERKIETETGRGKGEAQITTNAISEGFKSIGKIQRNVRNIDRAIAALDRGARTGAVDRFLPSVTAASRELDQIRNELGLDVIGSVTFGALSEGELGLALETALPTGLNEPALKDFLQRKRDAQTKLVDYLDEQIAFLEGGGTLGEWRNIVNERGAEAQNAAQRTEPVQTQQTNQVLRFDAQGNLIQ